MASQLRKEGVPGVSTRSFASLSARLRPSVLLIGLLIGGFSRPAGADAFEAASATLFIASELSLGIDMLQTLDGMRHPGVQEANPILGSHPSDAKICAYFAAYGGLTATGWYFLPKHWRPIVPLLVLAVQVPAIVRNARLGYSIPF